MTSFLVKSGQTWSNLVKRGQIWSTKYGQKKMVEKDGQIERAMSDDGHSRKM
jgi:hypothetical protein